MSVEGLRYALTVPKLTSSERLLFIILADAANKQNTCFPSQKWLGKRSGLSIRTIIRALQGLEAKGHLEREERYIEGSRTSDLYHLRLPLKGAKMSPPPLTNSMSNPYSPYGVVEGKKEAPSGAGLARGAGRPALRSITGGRA